MVPVLPVNAETTAASGDRVAHPPRITRTRGPQCPVRREDEQDIFVIFLLHSHPVYAYINVYVYILLLFVNINSYKGAPYMGANITKI